MNFCYVFSITKNLYRNNNSQVVDYLIYDKNNNNYDAQSYFDNVWQLNQNIQELSNNGYNKDIMLCILKLDNDKTLSEDQRNVIDFLKDTTNWINYYVSLYYMSDELKNIQIQPQDSKQDKEIHDKEIQNYIKLFNNIKDINKKLKNELPKKTNILDNFFNFNVNNDYSIIKTEWFSIMKEFISKKKDFENTARNIFKQAPEYLLPLVNQVFNIIQDETKEKNEPQLVLSYVLIRNVLSMLYQQQKNNDMFDYIIIDYYPQTKKYTHLIENKTKFDSKYNDIDKKLECFLNEFNYYLDNDILQYLKMKEILLSMYLTSIQINDKTKIESKNHNDQKIINGIKFIDVVLKWAQNNLNKSSTKHKITEDEKKLLENYQNIIDDFRSVYFTYITKEVVSEADYAWILSYNKDKSSPKNIPKNTPKHTLKHKKEKLYSKLHTKSLLMLGDIYNLLDNHKNLVKKFPQTIILLFASYKIFKHVLPFIKNYVMNYKKEKKRLL